MRLGIVSYFKMVWFYFDCKNLSTGLAVIYFAVLWFLLKSYQQREEYFDLLLKHITLELQSSQVHSFNADVLSLKSYKGNH